MLKDYLKKRRLSASKRILDDTVRTLDMAASISGTGRIGIYTDATISVRNVGTDRVISANKEFERVKTWADLPDESSLKDAVLYEEVLSEIKKTSRVSKKEPLQFFRGRIPPFNAITPTCDDMGPLISSKASAGRYNNKGDVVLYCSTTTHGVEQELNGRVGEIWIQRFCVSSNDFIIADFSQCTQQNNNILNNLFWFTELAGADG